MNHTDVIPRQNPPDNIRGRPWTTRELLELRRLAPLGAQAVAELLGRSVWSVVCAAHRHRISLRREGERAGRMLGEPRPPAAREVEEVAAALRDLLEDLMAGRVGRRRDLTRQAAALRQLREDALAGRVDLGRVARRARAIGRGDPLCPACARRPQEVRSTGLCEDCHLRALAEAHRLESERAEAVRELDRERQRKHRGREREGGRG